MGFFVAEHIRESPENARGDFSASCEDPFGNIIRSTGPAADDNPFRFSTKYQDDETGLVYYGRRFYSSALGRWVSRDPLGELGGLNSYSFILNSPINGVDAIGLLAIVFEVGDGTSDNKRIRENRRISHSMQIKVIRTRKALEKLRDWVTDKLYRDAQKRGDVKLDGVAFPGTKAELEALLERETKSTVYKGTVTLAEGVQAVQGYAKQTDKEYDYLLVAAHGTHQDQNGVEVPTGYIKFRNGLVEKKKVHDAFARAAEGTAGSYLFVSCYYNWKKGMDEEQTKATKEAYEAYFREGEEADQNVIPLDAEGQKITKCLVDVYTVKLRRVTGQ